MPCAESGENDISTPLQALFTPPMPPRKKAMPPHEDIAFPSFRHVRSELYFVLNVHFDVQAE